MSEEDAFLAAIQADPTDDSLRLVYADWLDEHGRPEAEFIRLDCELAALERQHAQDETLKSRLQEEQADIELAEDSFSSYFEPRCMLIAKLGVIARHLNPEWVARVSRVPDQELNARIREIQSWLRQRVTVAQMLARMAEWDERGSPPRSVWRRIRAWVMRSAVRESQMQSEGPHVRGMREWVETNMQPGDELWEYDSGGESWANLCGECGYAIVRDGKLIEFTMLLMN